MDPVTSPLIHKDSGRQARVDPGEENPSPLLLRGGIWGERIRREEKEDLDRWAGRARAIIHQGDPDIHSEDRLRCDESISD